MSGLLSASGTLKGRMQRAVLQVLHEHRDNGELPTSGRFLFYELEGRGIVRKSNRNESRRGSVNDPREQEIIDALTHLRERGIVPWWWIEDGTRRFSRFSDKTYSKINAVVNIDPWQGWVPLVLVESRSLGGVLSDIASEYRCDLAATNGQANGFLRTEILPVLADDDRPVLYLGDWDHQGRQIETNTRRVLERETGREVDWVRIAITEEQIAERNLTPIWKKDHRYRPVLEHQAWEAEALGQGTIQRLVRGALDALLPEPLTDVLERESAEEARLRQILDRAGLNEGEQR